MQRVNERELEALRKLYPDIKIKRTRHNRHLINANEDQMAAYRKVMSGNLSNKQKKDLYWQERRRLNIQQQAREN